MQKFKLNDQLEDAVSNLLLPQLEDIGDELDNFWEDAFEAFNLGDVLYNLKRDPMYGVIEQESFRQSFFAIHELFTRPGTFEFYMNVFRSIWGDNVEVEFNIPSPGVLEINAQVLTANNENFVARRIEGETYFYDKILTDAGDNLMFQVPQGIKSQNEANELIFQVHPVGVFTTITLELE